MKELLFERAMALFFGAEAYQLAGTANSEKERKEWYLKVVKEMQKIVDAIDTTPNHKKRLFTCLDRLNDALNDGIPSNQIIDILVMFCGFLFGFELDGRGSRTYSVEYWQNKEQYYTEKILQGADVMQDYYDKKNIISVRKNIIEKLKAEGFNTFMISLILNTTEYQIKKLLKN